MTLLAWLAQTFLEALIMSLAAAYIAGFTGSLGTIRDFALENPSGAALAALSVLAIGCVIGWNARRALERDEPEWRVRWRVSGRVGRLVSRVTSLPRQQLAVLCVAMRNGQFLANGYSEPFCLMLAQDGYLTSNGGYRYGAEWRTSYSVPNELSAAISRDRRAAEAIAGASVFVQPEWGYEGKEA